MRRKSIVFLQAVIVLMAAAVLAICVFDLPGGLVNDGMPAYRPVIIGLYVTSIPFYIALYQAMKLLSYIGTEKAFSIYAVRTLVNIKRCGIAIGAAFLAGSPYLYYVAQLDDAPGVLAIGLVVAFASGVIAVFAAVLQQLLTDALAIKSENDLTV